MPDKKDAPQRDLSKFSSIISHLTLPLVVGKAVGEASRPEAAAAVGAFAKAAIEGLWSERQKKLSNNYLYTSGRYYHDTSVVAGLELGSKKEQVARMFEQASIAVGEEEPAAFERAAQALSHHLCASYERQDQPGLGFPLFGQGLRRSKSRVDGVTVKGVSGWRGAFEEVLDWGGETYQHQELGQEELDARELLKPDLRSRSKMDDSYQATYRLQHLPEKSAIRKWADQAGATRGHYYGSDLLGGYRFGIDLAGKQKAMAKTESPIPSLERVDLALGSPKALKSFSSDEQTMIEEAGNLWKKFVSAQCSLAALALAGDRVDLSNPVDTQALRPFTTLQIAARGLLASDWTPPQVGEYHGWRHEEQAPAPRREKVMELAARYERAPLTFAAQLAYEIATDGVSAQKSPELAEAAGMFLLNLQARAKKLGERALAIAKERQAEWFKKEGLESAWAAVRAGEPYRLPSAKAVNWALANPETAALSGSGNKRDSFAASLSRPLGISAPDAPALWERVRERFAQLGVGEGALEWAAGNSVGALLASEAQAALPLRGLDKQTQLDRFALLSRMAQAAFDKGLSVSASKKVFDLVLGAGERLYRSYNAPTRSAIEDNLSESAPFKTLVDVKGAQELERQATAKKEKLNWLVGQMVGHFADELAKNEGSARELSRQLQLLGGADSAPRIDWVAVDEQRHSWTDVVYRRPASQAAAMRDALANGGVPGMVAAACAPALGIEQASGGNELIALVREELKARWGMNNAAWKNFLKAPAIVIEEAIAPLREAELLALRSRREQAKQEGHLERSQKEGALRGAWISAMTQYNLPAEPVHDMLSFIKRVGHLGFDPVAEWGPFARAQERGDAPGARFFIQEARAKEERLPHVIKAVCEQYALRLRSELERAREEESKKAAKASAKADEPGPAEAPSAEAMERARKSACAKVAEDWRLVADWIAKSEDGLWQTLPAKPSWKQLWQAQKEWHDEMAAIGAAAGAGASSSKKSNPAAVAWPSPLGRHVKGEWSAVELTNGSLLSEEGREMGHCVSSYSSNCRSGQLRILSIRFAGQRVCTMELRIQDGRGYRNFSEGDEKSQWAITQNKGKFNASVTDASALEFCEETRVAYQSAYSKKIAQEREAANKRAQERRAALKLKVDAEPGGAAQGALAPAEAEGGERGAVNTKAKPGP